MYNLLVTARRDAWDKPYFALEESRFLEHTEDALKERFANLGGAVSDEVTRLPSVFTYELGCDQPARVGRIKTIRKRQGEIRITFEFDPRIAPITTEKLVEHAWDFDLDSFEMNRTHWAIKDGEFTHLTS